MIVSIPHQSQFVVLHQLSRSNSNLQLRICPLGFKYHKNMIQYFQTSQNSRRQHLLTCKAFTLQQQVTGKTSSKNFHLQGYLRNPVPPSGGKRHFLLSHPTLFIHVIFTNQNPPWCGIINSPFTQHPIQMGSPIPNHI